MTARRWCIVIFGSLGAIGLGGAAVYWGAANGYLTRPVTMWLSARLGRTLEASDLRIELGRTTRLQAADLRLANVPWGTRPDMLLARNLVVELDTRSLLRDTVVIRRLTVLGLDLQLERNATGENNWTFKIKSREPSYVAPVIVESASLSGAKLGFVGPRMQGPLKMELDGVEQRELADGRLDLAVRGAANGTPLELQMTVGPVANLIAARHFGGTAYGRLGEITLGLTARVDSLEAPSDTEVALRFEAPNADYLATHLGLKTVSSGPVALEIKIKPAVGNGVQGFVSGQVGEFAVSAQGSLVKTDHRRSFALQAHVAGSNLSRLAGLAGLKLLPSEPFQLQLDLQRTDEVTRIKKLDLALADGRVSASGTLGPDNKLSGSDVQFSVATPDIARVEHRLGIDRVLSGPLEAIGSLRHLKAGSSELQLDGTTTVGTFSLKGFIARVPNFYGTRVSVSATGADFAPLGRALKLPTPLAGAFKATGDVEWTPGGVALRSTTLSVADEMLKVDGSLGRPVFAPGANLRFEISGSNAARMGQRFGLMGVPASEYRVVGQVQRQKNRTVLSGVTASLAGATLALDGTLGDIPTLPATDLTFTLNGSALENFRGLMADSDWPRGKFRAEGALAVAEGVLHLRKVQATLGDAHATLSADLPLPLTRAEMQFAADARVPDLSKMLPELAGAVAAGKNLRIVATGARVKERWSMNHLRLENDTDLLDARGEFDMAPSVRAKDLLLNMRLANLRNMGLPGTQLWPEQPLALQAKLALTNADLALSELTGRLGSNDFTGAIAVHDLRDKPDFEVQLDFGKLDLKPLVGSNQPPHASPASKKSARTDQRLVIPTERLRFPDLTAYTGKMTVSARELHYGEQDFSDLTVRAMLRDGNLRVEPRATTGAGAQFDLRLDLVRKGEGVAAQLSGTAKNVKLSPLLIGVGGPDASLYSALVELQGSGASLHDLAGTLNGRIRLIGGGGRVANSGLMAGSNDFLKQLLTSLNPVTTRQPTTEVVCVAYLLRAKDGVLSTDPALVVRTAEVDIISNGTADLHTEKIDFNFKTAARRGLGLGVAQLVNPYIKVTGTLGRPGVALDPTGALVNGGAAFATAGLSVVATTVWDRVVHQKDPCAAAVTESDRRARD